MSYAFQVRKRNGTLEVTTEGVQLEHALTQIPDDALYVISGHTPGPDTSPIGQLQVNLLRAPSDGGPQEFLGSASGSYNTREAGQ